MTPQIEKTLTAARDALEALEKLAPKVTGADLIDCAARVDALRKRAEKILGDSDSGMKAKVLAMFKGDAESAKLAGGTFEVVRTIFMANRFNVESFRTDHADLAARYTSQAAQTRLTFKAR